MPRLDPETSYGLVTDVCLKRKIRNYVELAKGNVSPFEIYVREKAVLTTVQGRAYEAVGKESAKKGDVIKDARAWMCANFFDVRSFGAVMVYFLPIDVLVKECLVLMVAFPTAALVPMLADMEP